MSTREIKILDDNSHLSVNRNFLFTNKYDFVPKCNGGFKRFCKWFGIKVSRLAPAWSRRERADLCTRLSSPRMLLQIFAEVIELPRERERERERERMSVRETEALARFLAGR